MKIVFFGTSPFGIPSLEALLGAGHSICAVVTTADKPAGRNLRVTASPVKEWAAAKNLPVIETSREAITTLGERLRAMNADVFVVISFGVILPQSLLDIPAAGALNVHSSLLPRYRGPAPIHWALMNGDAETGVTVMRMAASLDTGDILVQKKETILDTDDERSLHERLSRLGASALIESLTLIDRKAAVYTPQSKHLATYARKITKEDGRIDWSQTADVISRRVRALAGWPGTYTFLHGKRIIILKASVAFETHPAGAEPGFILQASVPAGILVAAKKSVLCIEELQAEGRKPLSAAAFLTGYALKAGEVFE